MALLSEPELCSIGKSLNEKCNASHKIISDFDEEKKKLLSLRCGLNDIVTICDSHERAYFGKFVSEYGKYCCDPFNKHKKRVKGKILLLSVQISNNV